MHNLNTINSSDLLCYKRLYEKYKTKCDIIEKLLTKNIQTGGIRQLTIHEQYGTRNLVLNKLEIIKLHLKLSINKNKSYDTIQNFLYEYFTKMNTMNEIYPPKYDVTSEQFDYLLSLHR